MVHAAKVSLSIAGKRDAAAMLAQITESPTRATKIKKSLIQQPVTPEPYSPDKALAVFINTNLTKHSYNLLRDQAKMQNCFIYPSYYKILQAKAECYPNKEDVNITEYSAEINLQALLDLTGYSNFWKTKFWKSSVQAVHLK